MSPIQLTPPSSDGNLGIFLWGLAVALGVVTIMVILFGRRRRKKMLELDGSGAPVLVMPVQARPAGSVAPLPPVPMHEVRRPPPPPLSAADAAQGRRMGDQQQPRTPASSAYVSGPPAAHEGLTNPLASSVASNGSSMSDKIVHALPMSDGTLQFLPGRLVVLDGDRPGKDIRFVRTWGQIPEITFGRVTGPPYRHVQLRSQTVSRQHARLQYEDGRWQLTNLSQTNPVVVNGETLDTAHGQRVLRDGDQIEMGEVVFRFRDR
jgi:hypothetical protein